MRLQEKEKIASNEVAGEGQGAGRRKVVVAVEGWSAADMYLTCIVVAVEGWSAAAMCLTCIVVAVEGWSAAAMYLTCIVVAVEGWSAAAMCLTCIVVAVEGWSAAATERSGYRDRVGVRVRAKDRFRVRSRGPSCI